MYMIVYVYIFIYCFLWLLSMHGIFYFSNIVAKPEKREGSWECKSYMNTVAANQEHGLPIMGNGPLRHGLLTHCLRAAYAELTRIYDTKPVKRT